MTLKRIKEILDLITFSDLMFRSGNLGDGFFVGVSFEAECTTTGKLSKQNGRKWYISPHAIDDEVVKTAWLAVQTALIHEALEEFKYKGVAIFHAHTNVEDLVEVQRTKEHVRRPKVVL